MRAPANAMTVVPSPLGSVPHSEREQVIAVLTEQFTPADAVEILTTLARTRAGIQAVPMALQEQAQRTLLATLPPGTGALVSSTLGIPTKSDREALEEVLTIQEKTDSSFRQRVEAEALRRHIPRWLAASRLRWAGMDLDELAATLQHQPEEQAGDPKGKGRGAQNRRNAPPS